MEERAVVPYDEEYSLRPADDVDTDLDDGVEGPAALLWVLLRKWYMVLFTASLIIGAGLPAIWMGIQPEYKATSAIEIAPVIPRIVFQDESAALPYYANYVNTQAALIRSNLILYPVLEDPAVRNLQYLKKFGDPLAELQASLRAEVDHASQLMLVSMTGDDPRAAAEIANAAVRCYMRVEGGNEATSEDDKLRTLERERDTASERLRGLYESAYQMGEEYGTTDLATRENMMLSRLSNLQLELMQVENAKIALQAQAQRLADEDQKPPSPADMVRLQAEFVQSDDLVKLLSTTIAQSEQDIALSPIGLKEDSRIMENKRRALGILKTRLAEGRKDAEARFEETMAKELSRQRQSQKEDIDAQMAQLESHEQRINDLLAKENAEVIALGRKAMTIKKLQDEVSMVNDLYQTLVQRIQQLQVERQRPARTRVAYAAEPPRQPSRDKRRKYSVVLVMGGLLFASALTVFLHQLDMRVDTPAGVASRCRVRILGTTPRFKDLDRARVQARHFVDDCRTIRVNLSLSDSPDRARVLVMASPQGRDGKTTVAINLATSIALAGKRVLLIDGDLRKPEVARYLRMKGAPGLASVLAGECSIHEAIKETVVPTLHILPAARNGQKQSELLVSRRLSAMLAELRGQYEEIIVDTPAVLALPDAKLWACMSDGVILVARSGKTTIADFAEAKVRMQQSGARIVGAVITGVRIGDSYERYSHRYAEGYVEEPISEAEWDAAKVFLLSRHAETLADDDSSGS